MLIRLSLYTLLLCLVPIFAWIFNWHWQGDATLTQFDYFLYWLTETGSAPYGLITCGVFALLFYPLIPNRKQWILAVCIMAGSVIVTQGVKSGLKTAFAEPRPYVIEISEKSNISTDYFYEQPRSQREQIVHQFYAERPETPSWVARHRADETGYTFPSGHTIFAVSWLLITVGFTGILGSKSTKSRILVVGMAIWAVLMLVSRLRLGLHYPIDLLISTLIAWLLHSILFVVLQKKAIFNGVSEAKVR